MSIFSSVRRAASAGFGRMIEARQRQVNRYIDHMVLHFDDETLKGAGISRADVHRRVVTNHWV